jgi:hypothetical protein
MPNRGNGGKRLCKSWSRPHEKLDLAGARRPMGLAIQEVKCQMVDEPPLFLSQRQQSMTETYPCAESIRCRVSASHRPGNQSRTAVTSPQRDRYTSATVSSCVEAARRQRRTRNTDRGSEQPPTCSQASRSPAGAGAPSSPPSRRAGAALGPRAELTDEYRMSGASKKPPAIARR